MARMLSLIFTFMMSGDNYSMPGSLQTDHPYIYTLATIAEKYFKK